MEVPNNSPTSSACSSDYVEKTDPPNSPARSEESLDTRSINFLALPSRPKTYIGSSRRDSEESMDTTSTDDLVQPNRPNSSSCISDLVELTGPPNSPRNSEESMLMKPRESPDGNSHSSLSNDDEQKAPPNSPGSSEISTNQSGESTVSHLCDSNASFSDVDELEGPYNSLRHSDDSTDSQATQLLAVSNRPHSNFCCSAHMIGPPNSLNCHKNLTGVQSKKELGSSDRPNSGSSFVDVSEPSRSSNSLEDPEESFSIHRNTPCLSNSSFEGE